MLENLATVLATEGRVAEAEPLARQAIQIGSRTEGPSHPDVGMGWVSLGVIHRDMGKLPLARIETARGMSILAAAGPSAGHYFIKANTENARLLIASGQARQAVPILTALLDSATTQFRPGDPRLADVQDALGQALLASGNSGRALPLLSVSHQTLLRSFGPKHPQTITAERDLESAQMRNTHQ